MKSKLAFACGLLLRVLACILLGTLLLALVYCIPEASMEENLRRSALDTIRSEGFPVESLVRHYEEGGYEYISSYPQYWHG